TGKYRRGQPMPTWTRLSAPRFSTRFANEQNFEVVERLAPFCAQRGRTMLELAFCWLLAASVIALRPPLSRCGRTRCRSAGSGLRTTSQRLSGSPQDVNDQRVNAEIEPDTTSGLRDETNSAPTASHLPAIAQATGNKRNRLREGGLRRSTPTDVLATSISMR